MSSQNWDALQQSYIEDLRRVYSLLRRPFTRREYRDAGKFATRTLENCFGSWSGAMEAAGILDEEIAAYDPSDEMKRNLEEEKRKILDRAERRQAKEFKERQAKFDIVSDMVQEAAARLEPSIIKVVPSVAPAVHAKKRCVVWFEFSDLQLGTKITAEELSGLNEHDWDIWLDKLDIWKETVKIKLESIQLEYNIDGVVLACLGDMVEGHDIFGNQVWQVDRPVADQAILGAENVSVAFAELFATFPHLRFQVLEVFGNHGRVGKKGETPYNNSWDKVFQRFLEVRLRAMNLTNWSYIQNECYFYWCSIYGWNHILLHGDQGMGGLWSSRPTVNGLEKGIVRYNQMLQNQVHFVHVGHFHQDWQLSFNMSQMLINGSFIGTSTFSAAKMVSASPPVQVMHIFEPRVGLERTERIHLTTGDVRKPLLPHNLLEGLAG